jgi:CRP/FNR family cyclic AMP-dependent transcriptional regulator
MEIETLKTLLKEHSFVRGLDDRYVDLMVSCATNVRFQPGEYIFREGGSADQFYLLRHGRATVEIYAAERGSITVMTVGEGEVLVSCLINMLDKCGHPAMLFACPQDAPRSPWF